MEVNKNHDEVISRLLGRAKFIRDTGGIKSAELLEKAAEIIKHLTRPERATNQNGEQ